MAHDWLETLKRVEWDKVIDAAPKVAGGARSLWDAVANKSTGKLSAAIDAEAGPARMTVRIDQNETALAALHAQMLSASEIITTLADQNTLMIAKIEIFRVRFLWLSVITAAALIIALGSLVVVAR
jgi:hypothetical protein